jgi:cytochrome bd-type quinol oxidase subunit 2
VWWYLFAALVFTGVNIYLMIDAGGNFADHVQAMPWLFHLPIGSAIILAILGLILKLTARKKQKT